MPKIFFKSSEIGKKFILKEDHFDSKKGSVITMHDIPKRLDREKAEEAIFLFDDKTKAVLKPEQVALVVGNNNVRQLRASDMTMREFIAAAAMQGLLTNLRPENPPDLANGQTVADWVAGQSIAMADTLISLLSSTTPQ